MSEAWTLRQTLAVLAYWEAAPQSRFRVGSPCRFIRSVDIAVHIVLPEVLEGFVPGVSRYLRSTSPRWGRSWREW